MDPETIALANDIKVYVLGGESVKAVWKAYPESSLDTHNVM